MPTSQFGELAQVNSYGIAVSASSNAVYTLSGEDRNGDVSGNDPNLTFFSLIIIYFLL
jgi:N-acetylneuraminic acid mutarotase